MCFSHDDKIDKAMRMGSSGGNPATPREKEGKKSNVGGCFLSE